MNKKLKDFSQEERNLLYWRNANGEEVAVVDDSNADSNKFKRKNFEGIVRHMKRLFLTRDTSMLSKASQEHQENVLTDELCPNCHGKGVIVTELAFMDPIITPCESCNQTRYNEKALNSKLNEKSIVDVLGMSAEEAIVFFNDIENQTTSSTEKKCASKICSVIQRMLDCGLSYMELGQPLSTLSGGERQRVKLAKHLGNKGNIYILDEPTTGLHISDTEKLLALFDRIVDKGNTMIIIEHDLDVARHADWIIDVGPDGGKNGGQIVFEGTPMQMMNNAKTITAEWMRKE